MLSVVMPIYYLPSGFTVSFISNCWKSITSPSSGKWGHIKAPLCTDYMKHHSKSLWPCWIHCLTDHRKGWWVYENMTEIFLPQLVTVWVELLSCYRTQWVLFMGIPLFLTVRTADGKCSACHWQSHCLNMYKGILKGHLGPLAIRDPQRTMLSPIRFNVYCCWLTIEQASVYGWHLNTLTIHTFFSGLRFVYGLSLQFDVCRRPNKTITGLKLKVAHAGVFCRMCSHCILSP